MYNCTSFDDTFVQAQDLEKKKPSTPLNDRC